MAILFGTQVIDQLNSYRMTVCPSIRVDGTASR